MVDKVDIVVEHNQVVEDMMAVVVVEVDMMMVVVEEDMMAVVEVHIEEDMMVVEKDFVEVHTVEDMMIILWKEMPVRVNLCLPVCQVSPE